MAVTLLLLLMVLHLLPLLVIRPTNAKVVVDKIPRRRCLRRSRPPVVRISVLRVDVAAIFAHPISVHWVLVEGEIARQVVGWVPVIRGRLRYRYHRDGLRLVLWVAAAAAAASWRSHLVDGVRHIGRVRSIRLLWRRRRRPMLLACIRRWRVRWRRRRISTRAH